MPTQIQFRRGTAAQWTSANPVLAAGEMGIETDTNQFKVGNGSSAWSALSYGGLQGPAGTSGGGGDLKTLYSASGSFTSTISMPNILNGATYSDYRIKGQIKSTSTTSSCYFGFYHSGAVVAGSFSGYRYETGTTGSTMGSSSVVNNSAVAISGSYNLANTYWSDVDIDVSFSSTDASPNTSGATIAAQLYLQNPPSTYLMRTHVESTSSATATGFYFGSSNNMEYRLRVYGFKRTVS